MLKKLVKYGNSNALILDRAILELLNINEGALLKLQTDGKSLIITPQQTEQSTEIFATGVELLGHTVNTRMQKAIDERNANPIQKQLYEEWKPGTENNTKLKKTFEKIMAKYSDDIALLGTETFSQSVQTLIEQCQGDADLMDKEMLRIRLQHAPNLANMDKEIAEAKKALGAPDSLL
jgi:antitoxin component of MazEF toxin-antitoxin module